MSAGGRYVVWTPAAKGSVRSALLPVPLPRLTGTAWIAWRRHRAVYRVGAVLVLAAVVWAVWQRQRLVSGVHAYADTCRRTPLACHPDMRRPGSPDLAPPPPRQPAFLHFLFDTSSSVLAFVPPAVGAFLGGPLFAQDLESGTHRLAWTQSVSRRQWAGAKLAVAAGACALGATALSAVASWWWLTCWRGQRGPGETGDAWRALTTWDRWDFFSVTGPVAVAHTLLALLLGATAGLFIRRTLPAVAVAAALSEGALLGLGLLRPHLLPLSLRTSAATATPVPPVDAWHITTGFLTARGTRLPPLTCGAEISPDDFTNCLERAHVVGRFSGDHPMSRFLPLQALETGACLAATAALTALCLWQVHRVDTR